MSGNLFNDPRINKSAHTKLCTNLFNHPRINAPIQKQSGNLFNDPHINKSAHTKISGNLLNNPRLNVAIRKKYGNLFNDPRILWILKMSGKLIILASMCPREKCLETNLMILVSMKVPILKKVWKLI